MEIPLSQIFISGTTFAAELLALFLLRGTACKCSSAVKLYLRVQVVSMAILLPMAAMNMPCAYLRTWTTLSMLEFAAQVAIIYSVFSEMRGKSTAFGAFKIWISSAVLVGLYCALESFIAPSEVDSGWGQTWIASSQTLGAIRNIALVIVPIYGWISASSWALPACRAWVGLAVYSFSDFIADRLAMAHLVNRPLLLELFPTVVFGAALYLWCSAFPRGPSLDHERSRQVFEALESLRLVVHNAEQEAQDSL